MPQKDVPQIFDAAAQALAKSRAQNRMVRKGPSFLLTRCAEDAASRIADINRQFERGVVLAPVDMREAILAELPDNRQPKALEWVDKLEGIEGKYDLIISLLDLQTENDLPGALMRLRSHLKADGLFMASMFGGESLMDLRQIFYHIDQALFGGATARLYPMIDHQSAAGLLGRAGLNLPVVDKDRVSDLSQLTNFSRRPPRSWPDQYTYDTPQKIIPQRHHGLNRDRLSQDRRRQVQSPI